MDRHGLKSHIHMHTVTHALTHTHTHTHTHTRTHIIKTSYYRDHKSAMQAKTQTGKAATV